jgi:hypothetical protein
MLALCNTKFGIVNMVLSAVCRSLWKLRNLICFQGVAWVSLKSVWRLDPDAEMLEGEISWLGKCYQRPRGL